MDNRINVIMKYKCIHKIFNVDYFSVLAYIMNDLLFYLVWFVTIGLLVQTREMANEGDKM